MAELDQDNADLSVFTFKEGLLSPVAHDLKLKVGRWSAHLDKGALGIAVTAAFDPSSIVVEGVMREGKVHTDVLGARDADKIARTIREEVLLTQRHPSISWRGKGVMVNGVPRVDGEVTLAGKTKNVSSRVKKEGKDEVFWLIETTLHQPDFGIKPYTAMLGALKIKPDVVVTLRVSDRLIAPLLA